MNDSFTLEGKVIVVTGGTGVLGNAFVKSIAAAGAVVGILGRNEQVAIERAHHIISKGGKAIPLIADVTKEDELKKACAKMIAAAGHIDGLVNAAGGNMPGAVVQPGDDLFQLDLASLKQVMDLFLCMVPSSMLMVAFLCLVEYKNSFNYLTPIESPLIL